MYVEFYVMVNGQYEYSYREYYDDTPYEEIEEDFNGFLSACTFNDANASGGWHTLDDEEFFEKAYKLD